MSDGQTRPEHQENGPSPPGSSLPLLTIPQHLPVLKHLPTTPRPLLTIPSHLNITPRLLPTVPNHLYTTPKTFPTVPKRLLTTPRPLPDQLNGPASSGEKYFLTTPLPHHGPSGSYGYTTTTSFVNVQFGGGSSNNKPYPFTKEIRPNNNYGSISTRASVDQFDHKRDWYEISQYHLKTHRENEPALVKNSHIKQTTARPVLLPPLTPTVRKLNFDGLTATQKVFDKKPSLSFDGDNSLPTFRPVTLPPYIGNQAPHQPGLYRSTIFYLAHYLFPLSGMFTKKNKMAEYCFRQLKMRQLV